MTTPMLAKKLSESFITTKREQIPSLQSVGSISTSSDEEAAATTSASTGSTLPPDGSLNNLSAFEAAAEDIRTVLSTKGEISAGGITNIINRANNVVALTRQHFPAAIGSKEALAKVKKTLRSFDANPSNMLSTYSVCPDEINHRDGHIIDQFTKEFGGGKVFDLGGLGGIPFTGQTGWSAFSHHVPDGGHAFVLHASHIGISNSLCLGQYTRDGQKKDNSACGAAVGALCHCLADKPIPNLADSPYDYQQNFIINEIYKCMGAIEDNYVASGEDENAKQAALARQTHRIGKDLLDEIVSTDFGCDKSMLFVLSGIQLNMPFDYEDWFEPLVFEVRMADGKVVDLYEQTFGRCARTLREQHSLA
jgi:ribosomal protein L28